MEVFWELWDALGLINKVWGCALPARPRESEGIPCSPIQIFNADAPAWHRLSTGAAASRRRVFHVFLLGTSGTGALLRMGSGGKNLTWGSLKKKKIEIRSALVGAVLGISAGPWKG